MKIVKKNLTLKSISKVFLISSTHLLSLSGSHPGELGHVLHHLEVRLHLVRQASEVAELGDQGDGLGHVILLLGLPLRERRQDEIMLNEIKD